MTTTNRPGTTNRPPREIDGKGRTVRELLAGRKYSIDYYQREYKWQQKQITELICVFHGKAATHFTAKLPPITRQSCHP